MILVCVKLISSAKNDYHLARVENSDGLSEEQSELELLVFNLCGAAQQPEALQALSQEDQTHIL